MIYGYARVSSKGQKKNGNSIEDQKETLIQLGAQTVIEECYSGTTLARPKFDELMQTIKSGDTLIVTKFDRFARTAAHGAELIKKLVDNGITVHIANIGIVQNTPTGRLMIQIMLAFAEFERDMIVERTLAGKEIARQKTGYREGRPHKYTKAQLDHAMKLLKSYSYTQVESKTGISKSTLLREKKRRKHQNF